MSTLWVRHAPSSASVARKSVQAAFLKSGISEDDAFDAALIASELVGNAVRHARALPSGHLAVEWTLDALGYTISVTDGGSDQTIAPRAAGGADTGGRGLMIVAALALDWGVSSSRTEHGVITTTVWARGSLQAAGAPNSSKLQTTS